MSKNFGTCQICGVNDNLTKHHLIPQVKDRRSRKSAETISICSLCHTTIHAKFNESYLRDNLNTLEKILENDQMKKYIEWRKKHMGFKSNSTKRSW